MSHLAAQYAEAFAENCQLDPGSWFEEDTPDEQLVLLDNLVVAQDVVEQMLLNGETCWHHLGWWPDVLKVFQNWAQAGALVKVRLIAQWMLSEMPESIPDLDTPDALQKLSEGHFCGVLPAISSAWPAEPEFYLSRLQWPMFEISEFAEMDQAADVRTALVKKWRPVA